MADRQTERWRETDVSALKLKFPLSSLFCEAVFEAGEKVKKIAAKCADNIHCGERAPAEGPHIFRELELESNSDDN